MAFPGPFRAALVALLCLPLAALQVGADPLPPEAQPVADFLGEVQALVVDYVTHFDPTQDPAALLEQNQAFFIDLQKLVEEYIFQGTCVSFGTSFGAGPIVWTLNPVVDASLGGVRLVYQIPGPGTDGAHLGMGVYSLSFRVKNVLTEHCGIASGL